MKKIISVLCIATVLAQLLTPAALADAPAASPVSEPTSVSEPAAPQEADGLALGEESVITPVAGETVEVPTEGSDVTVRIRGDVDTADADGSCGVRITPSEDGQRISVTIEGNITADAAGIALGENPYNRPVAESVDVRVTGDVSSVGDSTYQNDGIGVDLNIGPGETVTATVDGNISGTKTGLNVQGWRDSDATVTVNGDITLDGIGRALRVDTTGAADITVNGNIRSSSEGVSAFSDYDADRLSVTINGNVDAPDYGVTASTELGVTEVTVNGDVNGYASCGAMGGESRLTVNGNVSEGLFVGTHTDGATCVAVVDGNIGAANPERYGMPVYGVSISGGAEASISGDVNGGINLHTAEYGQNNDGTLVIEGTAHGHQDGYALVLSADGSGYYPGEYAAANGGEADSADKQLIPTIEVYKLTPGGEGWFGTANQTYDENTDEFSYTQTAAEGSLLDRLVNSVRYLLHRDEGSYEVENAQTDASGRAYAQEGSALLLRPAEGFRITGVSAGEYASVRDNGDGTFTVQVARGGDLDIRADLQAIVQSVPAETAETANTETAAAATQLVYRTQDPDAVIHGVKAADRPALAAVLQALADDETLSAVTVHAMDSLLTAAERQTYTALGARDKLLLVLSVLTAADGTALPEGMSESARTLAEALRGRLGALEANALRELLGKAFGSGTAVLDGETVSTLRLALQTVRDGRTSYERYTFAEQGGAWMLLSVDSGYLL